MNRERKKLPPRPETLQRVVTSLPERLRYPEFFAGDGRTGASLSDVLNRCRAASGGHEDWSWERAEPVVYATLKAARLEAGSRIDNPLLTWERSTDEGRHDAEKEVP